MDFATTAAEWLDRSRQTKQLRPRTVEGYAYCLRLLAAHGLRSVEDLTAARVSVFLDARLQLGVQPGTLNRHIAAVCSFAKHLAARGAFPRERIFDLRALRFRAPPPPPPFFLALSKAVLVETASKRVGTVLERAVALDLATGLRASELAQIRHEELRLTDDRPYVTVARDEGRELKTYQARTVPVRRKDAERLLSLGLGDGREGPVFPAEKHAAREVYVRANTLGRRLALIRILVGDLGGKLDFLAIRHTFASWHVQAGVSLYKVSKWLGHRSIKTTEKHYAALAPGGDLDCELGVGDEEE